MKRVAIELPHVYARYGDEPWHVALATYPDSADTACLLKRRPMTEFQATRNRPGRMCDACRVSAGFPVTVIEPGKETP